MRAAGAALFGLAVMMPLPPSVVLWGLVMARGLLWR